jgi:hypothetical protein
VTCYGARVTGQRRVGPSPIDGRLLLLPRLVYAGLVASLPIYLAVVHLAVTPVPEGGGDYGVFYGIIGLFSAGVAISVPILRKRLMPPRAAGPGPAPDSVPPRLLGRWLSAQILSWSLCESVAIYGLVLAFVTHEPAAYYPFAAVALLLLALYRPRRRDLEAVARAAVTR